MKKQIPTKESLLFIEMVSNLDQRRPTPVTGYLLFYDAIIASLNGSPVRARRP